ncbi:uncharacterized protein TNCV_2520851 [Trichonephila clavipes]|nr:uncharacterized protein TNCV_2520851 [Trichonephila clavipes]
MIFIQKFAITCRVGLWNKQMPYFSSVSDEWSRDLKSVQVQKQRSCRATRGLLATDHVILNHGQVTWTTPELAPPLLTTTPHQREDVSALDRFNVHRCPTRRVFSGTGIELMTCLPWLDTLTTGLPQPVCMLGDKVSNLLVNLGEEELTDYESLKQVVLKEYEPSPKI